LRCDPSKTFQLSLWHHPTKLIFQATIKSSASTQGINPPFEKDSSDKWTIKYLIVTYIVPQSIVKYRTLKHLIVKYGSLQYLIVKSLILKYCKVL
jgi:hypothetical protein